MKEVWKPVLGFECCYEISNFGRIKSVKRHGSKGEYLEPKITGRGYPCVNLTCNGIKRVKTIHRLIAEHFIPNNSNKEQVNHRDGNRENFNISNLEWVTRGENAAHGYMRKGRSSKGWRIGTLRYIQREKNFNSVDEFLNYIETNRHGL